MTEDVRFRIKQGNDWPYDAPDDWYVDDKSLPPAPTDWAHSAARGVIADLTDRRGIKRGFDEVDKEIRIEIVATLAAIIRAAAEDIPAEIARLVQDLEGERDLRRKLDTALWAKDRAMGVLFERLSAAGVDCSDLIS